MSPLDAAWRMAERSNRIHHQMFTEILSARREAGSIVCVVRDAEGWLWLAREMHPLDFLPPDRLEATGHERYRAKFLMPIYGPCPDPILPLPAGYKAAELAVMEAANARAKERRVA